MNGTKRYCVWNNKGGVGKTFLTYILATEYAKANMDVDVVVIDMCPQGNVSETLLGGDGAGQDNMEKLYDNSLTIASYIKQRYFSSPFGKIGNEVSFFIRPSTYNSNLPKNMFLLAGDADLDICSGLINHIENSMVKGSWLRSRHLLCDLITGFLSAQKREQVFFIDCNPSFSPYTELAIVASTLLIVPCTADNASMRGLRNILKLLYGIPSSDNLYTSFPERATETNISLPKIHRIVLNKSRSHQENPSKAFSAHIDELNNLLTTLMSTHPEKFSEDCEKVCNIKDGNTLAAVLNHTGQILSETQPRVYSVYGSTVPVNEQQIRALRDDAIAIVSQL